MSIQSSINQMLGTSAIAAHLIGSSEMFKNRAKLSALNQAESKVADKISARRELLQQGLPESEESHQQGVELAKEHEDIMKQKFEISPSKSNLDNYLFAKGTTQRFQNKLTSFQAKQKAMEHMQNAQEERRMREGVSIYGAHGEVINGQK